MADKTETTEKESAAQVFHDDHIDLAGDDGNDLVGSEKKEAQEVAIAAHQLNRIDLDNLARSAYSWKSMATLRLLACILVQGSSTRCHHHVLQIG